MKVQFIGVGEAFEPSLGNTSVLVAGSKTILVDAGYAVPRNFFEVQGSYESVDAVYLTHFHADHTFGLPALLYRWHDEGRKKPLLLMGQPGIEKYVKDLIEFAYPGTIDKIGYSLEFYETEKPIRLGTMNFSFAKTGHNQTNYAICLQEGKDIVGISGDGELTEDSKQLFQYCTLLVHESFFFERKRTGHTNALEVVDFAKKLKQLEHLALVHIHHTEREQVARWVHTQELPFHLFVPKPFEMINL